MGPKIATKTRDSVSWYRRMSAITAAFMAQLRGFGAPAAL